MNSQNRSTLYIVVVIAIFFAFLFGWMIGEGRSPASIANQKITDLDTVTTDQFAPFWKVWQVLNEKSVNVASTTAQDKIYGAIKGLAGSYNDPYTVFFPPVESKIFQEDISGDFEGVGMEIGFKNKQLQVVSPLKGSPADRAGVKAGDFILKIGDKDASGMPTDQAVKLIRGPKGTIVKITFLPQGGNNGAKPIEKTIIREKINIPTIDTSINEAQGIFTIRLYSFTAVSSDLFRNALREFVISKKTKLILDLRGNPGGYLDASWDMASWFLPSDKIVVTEDFGKNAPAKIYKSKGYDIFNKNLKMVILVDGGSASASEILAGALQQNGIAKLVGTKTFGKGSVQELVPITSSTSLKVTIAHWFTPNGTNLSEGGLTPDYVVETTEKDILAGKDPVVEKAIELLK